MASRMCDGFKPDCKDKSDEDGEVCREWNCLEGKISFHIVSKIAYLPYVVIHPFNYMKLMIMAGNVR